MIRGFYSAASGLISQQTRMDTIGNNLANASTTAYKPQQTTFASLLYANVNGGLPPISTGHGVRAQQNMTSFEQGELQSTGRDMDFAILGEGFFALENEQDGTLRYTRDGNFQYKVEDDVKFVVTPAGQYVLNPDGERIELESDKKLAAGDLGIFSFGNPQGLIHSGGNAYMAGAVSGEAVPVEKPDVRNQYLEASKVDVGREMTSMIEASKAFSFNAKVVTSADEIEQIINQLR